MEKKKPAFSKNTEYIEGSYHKYKDWVKDPAGYFLVRTNKEKGMIEAGFCRKDNIIDIIITGKTPQEIYFAASQKSLFSRYEHAAYLGKELEKAYLALKYNLNYVQDEEIEIEQDK